MITIISFQQIILIIVIISADYSHHGPGAGRKLFGEHDRARRLKQQHRQGDEHDNGNNNMINNNNNDNNT